MSYEASSTASLADHRPLRRAEMEAQTGFRRSDIYNFMKERKVPKALCLDVRAVGLASVEIDQ